MHTGKHETFTDPIAKLLEYARELERACARMRDSRARVRSEAIVLADAYAPMYRRDLEQAVLPLLKGRVLDEGEDDDALARVLLLVTIELAELDKRWRALKASLGAATVARSGVPESGINAYAELWQQHVARLENEIIPALHTRLSEHDMQILGEAMALHRGIAWSRQGDHVPMG